MAPDATASRGQSSVLGVVLIVGVTVIGITGVLLFGASALEDAHTQSEIDAAEHAMTQLDSRFSLVALGSSERQGASIALRSGASMHVDGDSGWMNVSVYNRTSEEVDQTLLNTSLGAITYENGGTTVAYQGGGVWKRTASGGSVMVSPPELHYRTRSGGDPTLTLPLVVVRGEGTLTGEATVTKDSTTGIFPNASNSDHTNPLRSGEINITVQSEYYRAWGAFFESRTGGDVTYDHDRERVVISMLISEASDPVRGGIVSSAGSSTLEFHNHASADSYNSTDGSYTDTKGGNSSIIVTGDFELGNHGFINGSLEVGGSVTLDNNAEVTGDVSYGGTLDNNGVIHGSTQSGAEVTAPGAVDWLIDDRREAIVESNDNDDSDVDITGNSLVNCDSTCEVDTGNYYLDGIALDGSDHLLVDTTNGDVEIVVDGDASLGDAKVEVTGDGAAKFYVEGDTSIGGGANVTVPGQRSPGMWFYTNPGATFTLGNGARFVGVVYGPGSGAQNGVDIELSNDIEVYGGLVGDIDFVNNHMDIHFDEALVHEDPIAGYAGGRPTVTYLHITTNRVNVSSD